MKIILRSLLCLLLVACMLLSCACSLPSILQKKDPVGNGQNDPQEGQNELENETEPPKPQFQGEPLPDPGFFRYGYTLAQGNVKYLYELLVDAVSRTIPAESFDVDPDLAITEQELEQAILLFATDYPECFWFQKKYEYQIRGEAVTAVKLNYAMTGDELDAARLAMNEAVDLLLREMSAEFNTYEKAVYLHDKLAEHVVYREEGHHQTAYGALVNGVAVCAGYAAAYQLLLQKVGIPAYTVIGTGSSPQDEPDAEPIAHAWNVLWLSDGVCVYTDVTWDDPDEDYIFHAYFALSYEEIERDHTADPTLFVPPECNHSELSYYDLLPALVMTDTSSAQDVANLFYRINAYEAYAIFCYEGSTPFSYWFSSIASTVSHEIFHQFRHNHFAYRQLGNEYYVYLY